LESIPAPDNDALRGMAASIPQEEGLDRKRRLFDMLDDVCKFSAPKWMVDDEFREIWSSLSSDRKAGKLDPIDARKSVRQLRAEFHAIADRRVRLGLVLNVIGRRNNITTTEYPWGPPDGVKENKIVDFIFTLSR
jgi:trigger factor